MVLSAVAAGQGPEEAPNDPRRRLARRQGRCSEKGSHSNRWCAYLDPVLGLESQTDQGRTTALRAL